LEQVFGDDLIDSIIENELREFNEVAVRPHPHEFSMYADV
jgi:glutamine synthetase